MVLAAVWSERDRFLASGNAAVPILQRKVSAAKQVVRLRIRRRVVDLALQNIYRVVNTACGQQAMRVNRSFCGKRNVAHKSQQEQQDDLFEPGHPY